MAKEKLKKTSIKTIRNITTITYFLVRLSQFYYFCTRKEKTGIKQEKT